MEGYNVFRPVAVRMLAAAVPRLLSRSAAKLPNEPTDENDGGLCLTDPVDGGLRGSEATSRRRSRGDVPLDREQEAARKRELERDLEHLWGPATVECGEDELVVVCLLRNGRPYIKSFVEHYLSLGAKHLFFLDNGSTDGTVEALEGYEAVTVLRSTLPFKHYQMVMKRYLMECFGGIGGGRWVLYVDIDELFEYPYSEIVGLGEFLGYLRERSYTAVVGQMLDMFPSESVEDREVIGDEPLKERHRFYDLSNVSVQDYVANKREYRTPPHVCGLENVLADDAVETYWGGIKKTLFGVRPALTKHPLVFMDGETIPMDGSEHAVGRATVADLTCVLFHYNFTSSFYRQVRMASEEENYLRNSKKHKKYHEVLKHTPALKIRGEDARELRGTEDLVGNGFLTVSEDYMRLVQSKEMEEPEGKLRRAMLALLRAQDELSTRKGKPGGLKWPSRTSEDYGAGAANPAWTGQPPEDRHRKAARLEERNAELESRVRDLRRQLSDIHSSRSWRLVAGLGRLKNRIFGAK